MQKIAPEMHRGAADTPLVDVEDLTVRFVSRDLDIRVVNGVSFQIRQGEVLCLLGESGSGKSVTLRALMRLFPDTAKLTGRVVIDGHDILSLPLRICARCADGWSPWCSRNQ